MSEHLPAARRAAARLLTEVLRERRQMSTVADRTDGPLAALRPAERARAQALAGGVLRHLGRLDDLIGAHMNRRPPDAAMQLLRLAAFEMLADDVPAHAAVDSAVRLARAQKRTRPLAAMVNAVLRQVAREGAGIWRQQAPQALAKWMATPIRKTWGAGVLAAIEAAHERGATLDLTPRDPAEAGELAAMLGAERLPTGSLRIAKRVQVSALPGFAEGRWWVQDAAAALPARLLGEVADQRVLDLCAAPGGKTMQLAASGARVTALDLSARRLERLGENLKRTGLGAELVTADALAYRPDEPFDAVLLDAPCSASGTVRRHPELPFIRAGADLSALFSLQAAMIDAAVALLKPGGRLVFCTCSLLPREGETQAIEALTRHPGLGVVTPNARALGLDAQWLSAERGIRLRPDYWPERGGMDGFYMVAFQKSG